MERKMLSELKKDEQFKFGLTDPNICVFDSSMGDKFKYTSIIYGEMLCTYVTGDMLIYTF